MLAELRRRINFGLRGGEGARLDKVEGVRGLGMGRDSVNSNTNGGGGGPMGESASSFIPSFRINERKVGVRSRSEEDMNMDAPKRIIELNE